MQPAKSIGRLLGAIAVAASGVVGAGCASHVSDVATGGMEFGGVDVQGDVDLSGTSGFSQQDSEYLPIFKAQPIYPRRAQPGFDGGGIEGHVLLEFVVTATGAVRDPVVIEAEPPGVFDRAAIDAALQFKYKPKVVNGEPVEVGGVRNRINFELTE